MKYSLNIEFGKPDKQKRQKIYVRVLVNRKIFRISTGVYKTNQHKKIIDTIYKIKKSEVEERILTAIQNKLPITKELLTGDFIPSKDVLVTDYIDRLLTELIGQVSKGRLRHYKVLRGKIDHFNSRLAFKDISVSLLQQFEASMRKDGLMQNTISSRMKIFKAVIRRAQRDNLLPKDSIDGYKNPKVEETIPVFLTQAELKSFEQVVFSYGENTKKTVGFYFLLACYTGYRISDIYRFSYTENVQDNRVNLRANKNKRIVSIPVFSNLKTVLNYIKDHDLNISEDKFRRYVKTIAKDAGIQKDVKVHSGRHTFAMHLMAKGFSVNEVAGYLGDTVRVAAVYARLSPAVLDDKIIKAFGASSHPD